MSAGRLAPESGPLLTVCALAVVGLLVVWVAPILYAAERPLLEEKHTGAGLACNACHIEHPPRIPVQAARCLACHEGSYAKLARSTEKVTPRNPHESHQGELACGECHHVHNPSVDYCGQCHEFGFQVP